MPTYNEKKTLYIIRHGETDFNRDNIVQGSGVDTHLNELGRNQADAFYAKYREMNFDKVYTSVLQRSIQSVARFIAQGIPVEHLPELNEISWGEYEGKMQTDDQKAHYWEIVNHWRSGNSHAKIPHGESPHELQIRQQRALDLILGRESERQVLICMHGRAMKSILCLLLDQPISAMDEFQHSNLGLYIVEMQGNQKKLLVRNDTSHLNF